MRRRSPWASVIGLVLGVALAAAGLATIAILAPDARAPVSIPLSR